MGESLNNINNNIQKIETLFNVINNKLNEKDELIKRKDARITELTDKIIEASKDKDTAILTKIELIEAFSRERDENSKQLMDYQKQLFDQKEIIRNLEERLKQKETLPKEKISTQQKKQIDEKEINAFQTKIAGIVSETSGVFADLDGILKYLKRGIKDANRSLRLVVPTIDILIENQLIEDIDNLGDMCVVNIAASFKDSKYGDVIEKWKKKKYTLISYDEKNLFGIQSNGADIGIAYSQGTVVSGFFTNISVLVKLFNNAIMHAFLKGTKF